ncbi:MAG: DNA mismatch repair endonuclease MutL [Clostridia bacterium]|nr:DNA mismatch repair endonuclease MutL [Clostridia bacterium]
MPKINVLPREIYELIAAGEVVERPSSAVKELLENSVDAGADSITLEIKAGGIKYIRITDNGCGIAREDVRNAFTGHATSKITVSDDLDCVATLGFRGEALASIAAVSRVEMFTRTAEEETGTHAVVEGGQFISIDDAGCPVGTTIVVRDIFYNVPARMKFLKKDVTEANSVAAVADRLAVSHPEIAVRFIRDGKQTLCSSGDGKLISAVYAVYGKEFADSLIPVSGSNSTVKVEGYVSKPLNARANRNMQLFYVNGRMVRTKTACAALEEAFKGSVMVGKFPSCVLNLTMPYNFVDVNVHPAKTEVRFANEKEVFSAVYYAVKSALEQGDKAPTQDASKIINQRVQKQLFAAVEPAKQLRFQQGVSVAPTPETTFVRASVEDYKKPEESIPVIHENVKVAAEEPASQNVVVESVSESYSAVDESEPDLLGGYTPAVKPVAEEVPAPPEEPQKIVITEEEKPQVRAVGELFSTYILVEYGNELLLIDKHAAHERIIYEQLKAQNKNIPSQMLLSPIPVHLSREEYAAVIADIDLLADSGFAIEDFGDGTVIVSEYPVILEGSDIAAQLTEIAGYLADNVRDVTTEKLDWIFHSAACRAAVKAGDVTSDYELQQFAERVLSTPDIRYCPHGRPVLAGFTKRDIEKLFGRV